MVYTRIAALALALAPAFGQAPSDLFEKAPPAVDEALRGRVSKFYQAHVDGKFRLADQYVAEDSKDAFFAADKTRCKGFEITRITYEDQFAKARVVTACDTVFMVGPTPVPVKMPITTLWKVVNGEWFWYVEPRPAAIQTPYGKMSGGKEAGGNVPFAERMPDAAAILAQVKVDRTEVQLSSYEPASAEVTISNNMRGSIGLAVTYTGFPGFKATLDRQKLEAGQSAKLRLECKPADKQPKPTQTVQVQVDPTGQAIPIKVTFRVPPEIEKALPK